MLKIPKLIFENNFDNSKLDKHVDNIKYEIGLKNRIKTILIIDSFFKVNNFFNSLDEKNTLVYYYPSHMEPSTDLINQIIGEFRSFRPQLVIGIGGGSTLDTAKAVSNLINNDGYAENYQGWNLLKFPGVPKIGIPTIFGTGSETSSTCVLVNRDKSLKLGMNSPYTIFDYAIIMPKIQKSININLLIPTALDSFFHSIEILNGKNRNPIADDFAKLSLELISSLSKHEITDDSYDLISRASLYSGIALTQGMVGLIHPFSAALGVVLKIPHGKGNCIAMNQLSEFYQKDYTGFNKIIKKFNINLTFERKIQNEEINKMISVMLKNTKPLTNHLGEGYLSTLNDQILYSFFKNIGKSYARK